MDGCKAAEGLSECQVASHHYFWVQKVGSWGQEWSWG